MKKFTGLVGELCRGLDKLAGLCFFSVMLLIIANIVLRAVLKRPILGTYELVGILTAVGISLALAHCALRNGHIAVDLVVDRLPSRIQAIIDALTGFVSFIFWTAVAWYLFEYGSSMMAKGLVSSTAQIPIYPIIYLCAVGMLGLCLVLAVKFADSLKSSFAGIAVPELLAQPEMTNSIKKAVR